MCVRVGVYTCVKCKQNGCHSLCCCCRLPDGCDAENAVANTKRAKNASKLLESWKIEFCVPPGRTLRTAHTHTPDTHAYAQSILCVCVGFFGLLHASATNAHSKPIRAQRQTHTRAHHRHTQMAYEFEQKYERECECEYSLGSTGTLPHAKMNSLRFPSLGKKCCAYVAAFEAPAKQKFKLHFYFLDTLQAEHAQSRAGCVCVRQDLL